MTSSAFLWLALLVMAVGADETAPSTVNLPCDQYLNSNNYKEVLGSWQTSIVRKTQSKQNVQRINHSLTISEPTLEDIMKNNISAQSCPSSNPKILLSFTEDNRIKKNIVDVLLEVTYNFKVIPGYYNKYVKSSDIRIKKFGQQRFAMVKYDCDNDGKNCTPQRDIQLITPVDIPVTQEEIQAILRCYA